MPPGDKLGTGSNEKPPARRPEGQEGPRSIGDSQFARRSASGLKRFWNNYKALVAREFQKMDRQQQEALLGRFSLMITMGVSGIVCLIFYGMMPPPIRVLGTPLVLIAAWWAGSNIVTPVVIARFADKLNDD